MMVITNLKIRKSIMSVSFNVIENGNPNDPDDPKKFYVSIIMKGKSGIEEFSARIEKISTVAGSDIRSVLYSIIDIASEKLSEENSVDVDTLGTFRISISSEWSAKDDEGLSLG